MLFIQQILLLQLFKMSEFVAQLFTQYFLQSHQDICNF